MNSRDRATRSPTITHCGDELGSLAPVSRFTFCRRSSRLLPYRTVVCLPLSPLASKNRKILVRRTNAFDPSPPLPPLPPSSSFLLVLFRPLPRVALLLSSAKRSKTFFPKTRHSSFLFFFFLTKYSYLVRSRTSILDERSPEVVTSCNEASCRFSRALEQLYRKAATNCDRGIYRIALHRPVNRQLADLARKCKLAPVGRIGDRKKSKLSRQLNGCP